MARSGFHWVKGGPDRLAMAYVGAAGDQVDAVARAQYIETEIDATEAKERTPVHLGNLKNSVHAIGPTTNAAGQIETAIVAGGPSAPYAIYVHEDLDAFHKVGEAKFIESVIRESRPFMKDRIAKRARALVRRGRRV
jgi:hypothetical protein